MPVAIKIPSALRKALGNDEAEAALIDVLNQIQGDQRNGFERSIDMHLQAFREYLDRRLTEAETKTEKRLLEFDARTEKRFNEADLNNEKRFSDIKLYMNELFNELKVEIEKRSGESKVYTERTMADYHKSLLRWMFTFFIGTVLTLLGFMLTYLQLVKP